MDYKYTTTFQAEISLLKSQDFNISQASLKDLEELLPKDIDFSNNVDLFPVSFNAAVVNMFNKNGDGISTETAIAYNDNFIHKPTNIEHDKEKVVGHIVTAGFSEYGSSKILKPEDVVGTSDPFNISLGAVVYKTVNKDFTQLIERSTNPEDSYYNKISTSWEVGFTNYVLAVGSTKLNEAMIVSDAKQIEEMKGFLKCYGGSGKTKDGKPIYRLITGKIYPLGIGFTTNPAADVSGVYSYNKNIKKEDNISQNNKNHIKKEKNIAMDIENIVSELKELLVEKKFSEEAVASMTSNFADAIRQSDEKYRQDIEAAEKAKQSAIEEQEQLKASLAELQQKLIDATDRISVFENEKKAEEAVARFNSRMDALDSKFELSDEDRQFLANEIKSLDETEEAFAAYSEKLEILWKHKSIAHKEAFEAEIKARIEEEVAKRIATASNEEIEVEKALDNAEQTDSDIPNTNESVASVKNETFLEKFKTAFSRENVSITR